MQDTGGTAAGYHYKTPVLLERGLEACQRVALGTRRRLDGTHVDELPNPSVVFRRAYEDGIFIRARRIVPDVTNLYYIRNKAPYPALDFVDR
jgi:hypothetical protein